MSLHTCFVLLVFATGLRVQSLPTSTTFPVSLPEKLTTSSSNWTTPPQNTVDVSTSLNNNTQNSSLLEVTSSTETSLLPGNLSVTRRDPYSTSQVSRQEPKINDTDLEEKEKTLNHSSISTLPTSTQDQVTTPFIGLTSIVPENNNGTENASTVSPSPSDIAMTTLPPALATSSLPSWSPPKESPTSVVTESIPAENTTHQRDNEGSLETPTAIPPRNSSTANTTPPLPSSSSPKIEETTSHMTVPTQEVEGTDSSNTVSPRIIMEQVEHALSSGSIVAITVTVIAVVLLVFGVAAYLKIRHSSYGRLLDDHDYGSWGNYNNPLYDDS